MRNYKTNIFKRIYGFIKWYIYGKFLHTTICPNCGGEWYIVKSSIEERCSKCWRQQIDSDIIPNKKWIKEQKKLANENNRCYTSTATMNEDNFNSTANNNENNGVL